jgi:PAS domain S-box-containing protein
LSKRSREDISEIESSYQTLKQSEEKHRRIIDSVSDLVFHIDPNGTISFVNERITTLGYEAKELIGKPFAELYNGEFDEAKKHALFSRRIGPRSLVEVEISLKVNTDSSFYQMAENMSYLVSTSGLWNAPQEIVLDKDSKKEFLGTLLVARSQLLDLKL